MNRAEIAAMWVTAAAVLASGASCARFAAREPVAFGGATMGTTYSIKLVPPRSELSAADLQTRVDQQLDMVNRLMSTYQPDSDVSRFNRWESTEWFCISPETTTVVAMAQQIAEETGGRFDITVGPLVDLWSFGPDLRPEGVPTDSEIAAAQTRVGYQNLEVQQFPPAVRKGTAEVAIDLSAIAKGYAVDRVAELFDSLEIASYLIEVGGEVRARGRKPDGTPWRVGIERPVVDGRAIQLVVALEDRALASSGDYRNFFEWQGRRYSHEIDPRTGRPVEDPLAAASVLADNAMRADALATALMVMGTAEARAFAERNQLDVLLIAHQGDGFVQWMTPGFAERVIRTPD